MISFEKDLYICTVYNNPYSSGSNNCTLLQLQKDIERFSKSGKILLCGDFNARTACLEDFKNDYISTHIQTRSGYSVDKSKHNILKQNKDAEVNNWGREFTDLCKGGNLRILNGRTVGDLFGDLTYYKGIGKSAIDYIIMGKQCLENVAHFRVYGNLQ